MRQPKSECDRIQHPIKVYLKKELKDALVDAADRDERNLSAMIRKILTDWLDAQGEK